MIGLLGLIEKLGVNRVELCRVGVADDNERLYLCILTWELGDEKLIITSCTEWV